MPLTELYESIEELTDVPQQLGLDLQQNNQREINLGIWSQKA